jgi:hypothetical protein
MFKKNSLIKKFNKILISRIELIESFFNRIKIFVNLKKKQKINLRSFNNKITISIGLVIGLTLTYFLIPNFFDKNLVKTELEKMILDKYNLEVKFDGAVTYNVFPKPHYLIRDVIFQHNKKDLAKSKISKTYISSLNLFSLKNLEIKDLLFKKNEFIINYNNFNFFKKILNETKNENNIKFKNSVLFYKNLDNDIIFLTKISTLKYFNNEDFNQEMNIRLKIFNIPIKFNLENDAVNKKIFIDLDSHKIRLNIDNIIYYNKEIINGLLNFTILNKSKQFDYLIGKNSLIYISENNAFKGTLDFRPFYLTSDLNFSQLDISKIFGNNSILLNLINSEIFNNENLNANLNINFDKIKSVNHLKNFSLKTYFEEGNIIIKDSTAEWNKSILINLDDIRLTNQDNKLIFSGSVTFDFIDIDSFYSHYQIKRNHRKKIDKIKLDLLFNYHDKQIQLDNIKIDGNSVINIEKFVDEFNSKKIDIFNKVLFRNSIKEFFAKNYEG